MQTYAKHQMLVDELVEMFKQAGFDILAADCVSGFPPPRPFPNDGYGDQEPKAPDIYAFDESRKQFVIGEAKTGEDDFETEHALTQYNVFLDQHDRTSGTSTALYVIVPSSKIPEFNTLITHYMHRDYWPSIVLVSSRRCEE